MSGLKRRSVSIAEKLSAVPAKAATLPLRKGELTRLALIDAAAVVFARSHFQNARIADICAEAGRAVGVFYRYFSSKEEIFAACVDRFLDDLDQASPPPEAFDVDATRAIHDSTAIYWEKYRTHFGVVAGMFEIGMQNPDIADIWRKIRQNGIRRFSVRIRRQQAAGKCRDLDPDIAASALMCMLEFSCYNWNSRRLDFPDAGIEADVAVRNLFALIRNALALDDSCIGSASGKGRLGAEQL